MDIQTRTSKVVIIVTHKVISYLATALTLTFALGLNLACHRHEMTMERIGPDVKADLVVFLKKEATPDQIYTFSKETIGDSVDGGYRSLPGMKDTLLISVDGHEGYAITFFPDATEVERKYIRARIEASPLVFKMMENVVPAEIKQVR